MMRNVVFDIQKTLARPSCRHVAQPLLFAFVSCSHQNGAGVDICEQMVIGIEQNGLRIEIDADQIVARDFERAGRALHVPFGRQAVRDE